MNYLIGQNFAGHNSRNFELVPKILSAKILVCRNFVRFFFASLVMRILIYLKNFPVTKRSVCRLFLERFLIIGKVDFWAC